MRVLLLSAYHAASHARWCSGLMNYFSDWHWSLESLPARYFNWRSRGNSLSWGLGDYPQLDDDYDLIVATSMVDLSALKGFRPHLARVPTVVYCHENQFAYPSVKHQQGLLEIQLTNIYTALAADQILFNSEYNRRSFIDGAAALLAKMPDAVPPNLVPQLRNRSHVVPVPLEDTLLESSDIEKPSTPAIIELVWNHRWEWDKGPDRLLLLAQNLTEKGLLGTRFKWHVVGQQFRSEPESFLQLKQLLQSHNALGYWGFCSSVDEYRTLLARSHGVISTALHDFQGLAVLEAALLGCVPFVPNRLAYPEWFACDHLYPSFPDQPEREARAAAQAIVDWFGIDRFGSAATEPFGATEAPTSTALLAQLARDTQRLLWQTLGPKYRRVFALALDDRKR